MELSIPSFKAIFSISFWTRRDPAAAFICLEPCHVNFFFEICLERSWISKLVTETGYGGTYGLSSLSSSVKSPSHNSSFTCRTRLSGSGLVYLGKMRQG